MGYYTRSACEFLVLGTIGNISKYRNSKNVAISNYLNSN